jgi:hypothetical protein
MNAGDEEADVPDLLNDHNKDDAQPRISTDSTVLVLDGYIRSYRIRPARQTKDSKSFSANKRILRPAFCQFLDPMDS